MTPRFWDSPHPGLVAGVTLPQLVDRLTAHVEQEIVRTLGANAFLRLQIADRVLMDRAWHLLSDDETWVPRTPPEVLDQTASVAEAARLEGIGARRLYRAVERGTLTLVKVPGVLRPQLRLEDVRQWRNAQ